MFSVFNIFLQILVILPEVILAVHHLGYHSSVLLLNTHGHTFEEVVRGPFPDVLVRDLVEQFARRREVLAKVLEPVPGTDQIGHDSGRVKVGVAKAAVVERLIARPQNLHDELRADNGGVAEGVEQALDRRLRRRHGLHLLARGRRLDGIHLGEGEDLQVVLLAVDVGVKVALPLSDHVTHVAAEAQQAADFLGREDNERLAAFVEDAFVEPKVFEASPEVETALGGLGEILKREFRGLNTGYEIMTKLESESVSRALFGGGRGGEDRSCNRKDRTLAVSSKI